jgi:hypothetical protein
MRGGGIAEWNGTILNFFFFPLGEAQTTIDGTFRKSYTTLNLKIKK